MLEKKPELKKALHHLFTLVCGAILGITYTWQVYGWNDKGLVIRQSVFLFLLLAVISFMPLITRK